MKPVEIKDLKKGQEILVKNLFYDNYTKHTVTHTSVGHPGKARVYCQNGFTFTNDEQLYLNDAVSQTLLILEDTLPVDLDNE